MQEILFNENIFINNPIFANKFANKSEKVKVNEHRPNFHYRNRAINSRALSITGHS